MRQSRSLFALILILILSGCIELPYIQTQQDNSTASFSELDSYGRWIEVPQLGEVWQPDRDYDWRPYSEGQWLWTDRGWMWSSDEPYGWIVYHYGTWAFTDRDGWVWIPGYEWSPERVKWLVYDNYVAWTPIPPAGWRTPDIFSIDGNRIWVSVRSSDFINQNIGSYRYPNNYPGINELDRVYQYHSPDIERIQKASNRNLERIRVETELIRSGRRDLIKVRRNEGINRGENGGRDRIAPPDILNGNSNPARRQPPAEKGRDGNDKGRTDNPIKPPAVPESGKTPVVPTPPSVTPVVPITPKRVVPDKVNRDAEGGRPAGGSDLNRSRTEKSVPPEADSRKKSSPDERKAVRGTGKKAAEDAKVQIKKVPEAAKPVKKPDEENKKD